MDDAGLLRVRMGIVCRALQTSALVNVPDPGLTLTKLRGVMSGCGSTKKDEVIQELVRRKYVRVEDKGLGKAKLHFLTDPQLDVMEAQYNEFPQR